MAAVYRVGIDAPDDLFAGASCAFGVFDGVHRGHRFLLDRAREQARRLGGRFVVITFDIDPDERFHPERLKKLMSNEARIAELSELADAVAILPFTAELAGSSPDVFLNATFESSVPAAVHVGCDLRFGARAAGTVADLRRWGGAHGMEVRSHELFEMEGAPITATRIRLLLEDGRIEDANRLLGRRYSLRGTVLAGRGEGADMGFRTANLVVPDILRVLGDGVYAAYALVGGARYKAAVNVGVAASFADRATATCEAHLLDFEGDLYGEEVELEFAAWLRPMRKFDDIDELIATVMGNIQWVRDNL